MSYLTYVVFTNTELPLWRKLLKSGFGHCYALVPIKDAYIELNGKVGYLSTNLKRSIDKPEDIFPEYLEKLLFFNTVVWVESEHVATFLPNVCLQTCVSLVEYALGCRTRCFTPYGLYKKLTGKRLPKGILNVGVVQ